MRRRVPIASRAALAVALGAVCALVGCAAQAFASAAIPGDPRARCMNGFDLRPGPVTWRRYSEAEDVLAMDAWCESVGPAVVAGPVEVDGDGNSGGPIILDSLVVVTWNVHVGGGDLVQLVSDLRHGLFTDGRPVEDFVLLLQEAYRAGVQVPAVARPGSYPERILVLPPKGERLDILQTAERLGLHVVYVPSMRNGVGVEPAEDRGNAILSTMPVTETTAIELPYEAQRRVAVAATVQAHGADGEPWSLRVVSAHLDNRSRVTRFLDTFGPGRARQARALTDAVADPSAVVGADLNTWSAGFLESAVSILKASFPATPPTLDPTYNQRFLSRKLDHFLVRLPDGWSATVRRGGTPYGSDHYPLIGMVRRGTPAVASVVAVGDKAGAGSSK
jgi:endonuclease/exonuclease/phosphatase family metal-dependent hydrolase